MKQQRAFFAKGVFGLCLFVLGACAPAGSGQASESAPGEVPRITVEEVRARMARGEEIEFFDTRTEASWTQSDRKIAGAVRVRSQAELTQALRTVQKDDLIVTYCT